MMAGTALELDLRQDASAGVGFRTAPFSNVSAIPLASWWDGAAIVRRLEGLKCYSNRSANIP